MSEQRKSRDNAARGTALLSVRQVLVGTVTIVGIVVLPLLLGPTDFSLYGYVNMIVLLGAAVGDLGLGAYLIKHKVSKRQLRGMLGLQLLFWTGSTLFLMAIALILDPFGFSTLTYALLCAGLLLFALQSLPTALMERQLAFRQISLLEVVQRVILVSFAIGFAILEPSEWAIPLAALASATLLYPVFLRLSAWPGPPLLVRGEPVFQGFASQWWQTRIANQLTYATFPLLGGLLFTATDVGLLIWALSVSLIPGYLAPMAARAIYPVMARTSASERIAVHDLALRGLLLIGAPIVVFMFVAAPELTDSIFGRPWTEAVPTLRILLITSFLGIGLATLGPLAFLEDRPSRIKWLSVASTGLIVTLTLLLSRELTLTAIPIANLASCLFLIVALEVAIRKATGYSPLQVSLPAVIGLLLGLALGVSLAATVEGGLLVSVAIALAAAALQLAVCWSLGGGIPLERLRIQLAALRASSNPKG